MTSKKKNEPQAPKKARPEAQDLSQGLVPEVMTVEEAAGYLRLATATLYQKVSERSIPFTKIRNVLRFRKSDLDEWLQQNTVYPDQSTFEEFARWYSRHVFKEWLKSKGRKPQELSQKELSDLARQALQDLLAEDE